MTFLVYLLAVLALCVAAVAAACLHRELREDLRQDLQYAARRFHWLRIVITRRGRLAPLRTPRAHTPTVSGDLVRPQTSASSLRSTNGHRLQLVAHPHSPTTITALKGGPYADN